MSSLQTVIEHWPHVAPMLTMPTTEAEYDNLTQALDQVLDQVGDDEAHPLSVLASRIGDIVKAYDELHRPVPEVNGAQALGYLMREHGLAQGDLPEVGTQSVVSEILSGKRFLNIRQIAALSDRFFLPETVFIDRDRREARLVARSKPKRAYKKSADGKIRKKSVRRVLVGQRQSG